MTALISVQEAQQRILSFFEPVQTELVSIDQCAGRVLAEDLIAPGDLPAFDNSSMDGFAVLAGDVQHASPDAPTLLEIMADIPAGAPSDILLQSGQAARIMTGAPVPAGATAVVPVEDTNYAAVGLSAQPADFLHQIVQIFHPIAPGVNIRPSGQDIRQGQVLLQKGRKIGPPDVGILASVGKARVMVYRKPRVALFSSGDELVQPGQPLRPGQIYDANQFVLAAILEAEGAEILRLGAAPDDPEKITALLDQAIEAHADIIVTSAGVSVGAFDYVRKVIEDHGKLDFWKVNMRPGKPLAFGQFNGTLLIGLPGNPVSAFVGCLLFVLPAINRLAGQSQTLPVRDRAVLVDAVQSDGRESYLRAVTSMEGGRRVVRLTGHQGSGNIYSLVQANALLIVPSGVKSLPSGSEVEIWSLKYD